MPKSVDDLLLSQWRQLDALFVIERLGCYAKRDMSFHPLTARTTGRFHVNANGREFELLLNGPKFWDTRAKHGGGGAIDLTMHLYCFDFKSAVRALRTALPLPARTGSELKRAE